jgi:hypothetical protein
MEKVFDLHIHYTFELPLKETITIFKEEFAATGTEKYCFLSLPHEVEDDLVVYDELQNIKGLYLKQVFSPNAYAFAGLVLSIMVMFRPAAAFLKIQHLEIDQVIKCFILALIVPAINESYKILKKKFIK